MAAKKVLDKIKKQVLLFKKESKENGDLYGSIKPKEVSKYFSDKFSETVHPSQIDLKQEINKVGKFSLSINLHPEVTTELRVVVEKKEIK